MKNEILEEVWRNRDEFAREHNYDIDAMVTALQEMEKRSPIKSLTVAAKIPVSPPAQNISGTSLKPCWQFMVF